MSQDKHELITYNKKFKPGTAGVKISFSPDEMAFSREDMPLKAAIARREVLLSLQPQIDGVNRRTWNSDVLVLNPHEPYNPHDVHVSKKCENNPEFRTDFYDSSLIWDGISTKDHKLESKQFKEFTKKSLENKEKRAQSVSKTPPLVRRQIAYANIIKERGIPAAQPPPPFIVKKPKISNGSTKRLKKFEQFKSYHEGVFQYSESLGGECWSCCGNSDINSEGCRKQKINKMNNLYE